MLCCLLTGQGLVLDKSLLAREPCEVFLINPPVGPITSGIFARLADYIFMRLLSEWNLDFLFDAIIVLHRENARSGARAWSYCMHP